MNALYFAIAVASSVSSASAPPRQVTIQYAQMTLGRTVYISLDGKPAQEEFAGKLGFRDRTSSWESVCADVRSPIGTGDSFTVKTRNSSDIGGNIALAGRIVAKYFKLAKTPQQCAGLQLAVWEAIEDGGSTPDFTSGHFRARAETGVLDYADQFYTAVDEPGSAMFLQTTQGGGGGGQGQLLIN